MIVEKSDIEYLKTEEELEEKSLMLLKNIDDEINKLEGTINSLEKEFANMELSNLQKNIILQELNTIVDSSFIVY